MLPFPPLNEIGKQKIKIKIIDFKEFYDVMIRGRKETETK
jgi:hypothetical protein